MRFPIDANLSPRVADWLRARGHDAIHVSEVVLTEAPDREVLARAAGESRILLTTDLDFGALLAYAGGAVSAVIFRTRSTASRRVVARLDQVLAGAATALERGAVVVVEDARLRVRRLPFR